MSLNIVTPDSWSDECDQKQVKVEVLSPPEPTAFQAAEGGIEIDEDYEGIWFEIPTTEVELWINKHGSSDKNRIAKVKFPTSWDTYEDGEDASVVNLIEAFDPDNDNTNISYCRISFRDDAEDEWRISHHGFVGGVGQSSKAGVSKMWVYDFADLIDKIPVTENFNRPTAANVMETTMRKFNDQTPVRLTELALISPDKNILKDVQDNDIAAVGRTITVTGFGITQEGVVVDNERLVDPEETELLPPTTFYSNRDTLADVLDWLCTKLNAIWYFKPTETGVVLVVDVAGRGGKVTRDEYSQPQGDVSVIQNNATYEINPINTVIVRGSRRDGLKGKITNIFTRNDITKRFPYAKVRAQNLYESNTIAAGGQGGELAYLADGDATDIDGAVREAKDLLKELIEEEAEGSIKMRGKSRIETHDIIESHFTCSEWYPDEVVPLLYEVEEVKHHAKAGQIYKTTAYVSIFVGEDDIVVVEEKFMDEE